MSCSLFHSSQIHSNLHLANSLNHNFKKSFIVSESIVNLHKVYLNQSSIFWLYSAQCRIAVQFIFINFGYYLHSKFIIVIFIWLLCTPLSICVAPIGDAISNFLWYQNNRIGRDICVQQNFCLSLSSRSRAVNVQKLKWNSYTACRIIKKMSQTFKWEVSSQDIIRVTPYTYNGDAQWLFHVSKIEGNTFMEDRYLTTLIWKQWQMTVLSYIEVILHEITLSHENLHDDDLLRCPIIHNFLICGCWHSQTWFINAKLET